VSRAAISGDTLTALSLAGSGSYRGARATCT